tara:strand:+ start:699 stop:1040 length:342 start_codon:yes stop_codon:yes gene_type:complete
MANTFKLKNNAVMPSSAGTADTLYTVPSSTTTVIIGLTLANVHTSQVTVSVTIVDSSNSNETSHVVKDAPVPVGSSIEIMSGNKIILEASDIIKVDCSVADKISATMSIMEIT